MWQQFQIYRLFSMWDTFSSYLYNTAEYIAAVRLWFTHGHCKLTETTVLKFVIIFSTMIIQTQISSARWFSGGAVDSK